MARIRPDLPKKARGNRSCAPSRQELTKHRAEGVQEQIRNIIKKNLPEKITLDEVTGEINISKRQIQRILKHANSSFRSEQLQASMLTGQKALLQGKSVSEAAKLAGYKHPMHFSKAFRRYYGLPPKKWVQELRKA